MQSVEENYIYIYIFVDYSTVNTSDFLSMPLHRGHPNHPVGPGRSDYVGKGDSV